MAKSKQRNGRMATRKKTVSRKVHVKKTVAKKAKRAQPKDRTERKVVDRSTSATVTVEGWIERMRELSPLAESSGKPKGACMVADPAGGASLCVFTDRDTCKAIRGTFLGGPC